MIPRLPQMMVGPVTLGTRAIVKANMVFADGQDVYHSYNAGFIVLSYIVSAIGAWTALELLHKRTSTRGLYNWYLLLGAATSMGAVAIWSMHFIGNRAITMADGSPELQIAYSAAYSAGSFFLPICVVAVAFFLFSNSEKVSILGTIAGGTTSGIAICGMHYLGQGGISNYQVVYDWKYVLGSGIIAVVAATGALGVFFYFKSTWTNRWWKRVYCALMLGLAVSGMHWVATVGTSYLTRSLTSDMQGGLSRSTTVVVVLCLAVGCCVTLIAFAVVGQRSRQRYANRAQQVVLACAIWDPDGRLLVTPEGLLPCRKITNTYVERSFDDVFSIEHPVFDWIFRASHCWKDIADLIPSMRAHLRTTLFTIKGSRPSSSTKPSDSIDLTEDYSQSFKELFCVAAQDLATAIQQPLEDLGVLYDEIVSTGTLQKNRAHFFPRVPSASDPGDVERVTRVVFGRGQLLFIVRQAQRLEVTRLQANGFRFATVPNVIDYLARSMQVSPQELRPCLAKMRMYPNQPLMLDAGVHVACFALRPVFQHGFDILINKGANNLIPTVPLPIQKMEMWQNDIIRRFDDWEVSRCLDFLSDPTSIVSASDEIKVFFSQLHTGLTDLCKKIENPFFLKARLVARPLRAPCQNREVSGIPAHAEIIAFRIMIDVHQSRQLNDRVEFSPSRFFLCQQHVYPNSLDHAIFARRAHREFATIHERKSRTELRQSMNPAKGARGFLGRMPSSPAFSGFNINRHSRDMSQVRGDHSSEKNLVETPGNFGGIHVSNEVSVDVHEIGRGDTSPDIEMARLGVSTEAGVEQGERESFVDELMALTIDERRYQRP